MVLGVCGSIAAYKSAEVCSLMVRRGATVSPVMTPAATRFLGPTTLSALSGQRTLTSEDDDPSSISHIALARRVDVVVIAPATARLLAAYATGLADSLVTSLLLATVAPVVVAPAMHTEMWNHPATQANVALLASRGVRFVGPQAGRLAGGDFGLGRLEEPATIVSAVEAALAPRDLTGHRVLVTSGGTREPIDALRYLGNRSSGRQGEALAAEAVSRGATVTLVTTGTRVPSGPLEVIRVETAAAMADVVLGRAEKSDVVVMVAAVADFRPTAVAAGKLSKRDGLPEVHLEATVDIAAELGRRRRPGQVLVGFAAEDESDLAVLARHGETKRDRKGLDVVVANGLASFDSDTTSAVIVEAGGQSEAVPLVSKRELASKVFDVIVERLLIDRRDR